MNILQKIFRDHYEEMIYLLHPRPSAIENVDKMIHCGDPSFGGAMYHCVTAKDVRDMSEEALLDMDYFLNEDPNDDEFWEDGFFLF